MGARLDTCHWMEPSDRGACVREVAEELVSMRI